MVLFTRERQVYTLVPRRMVEYRKGRRAQDLRQELQRSALQSTNENQGAPECAQQSWEVAAESSVVVGLSSSLIPPGVLTAVKG
jgi:hypothetical protein